MGAGFHGGFQVSTGPDFYVGPNGGVLPARYKKWIGVNRRERLLKNGGTASILKFEKRTGLNTGRNGNSHYQKAVDSERYLSNKVLKENLTFGERRVAEKMVRSLKKSMIEWRS